MPDTLCLHLLHHHQLLSDPEQQRLVSERQAAAEPGAGQEGGDTWLKVQGELQFNSSSTAFNRSRKEESGAVRRSWGAARRSSGTLIPMV